TGVVGTPHYMSPEQAAGRPVDARDDLWALGLILHEALCGKRPHEASSVEGLLRQRREVPVPRPSELVAGVVVPPRVEATLMKALALDATQRWHTAGELRDALLATTAPRPLDPLLSLGAGFAAGGAVVLGGVALLGALLWLIGSATAPVEVSPPAAAAAPAPAPSPTVVSPRPAAPAPAAVAAAEVTTQDVARARAAALEAGA